MPTYQYACTECHERFERVQAFTDPTLTLHEPGCGGPVRKLFGSVGVVFKGTGFYRNDSRGSAGSAEGGGASASESSSGSSEAGTTKTESAPAPAKTESKPAASTPAPSTSSSSPSAA